jgi:dTDP-D-glucose 4,6-dehydratase
MSLAHGTAVVNIDKLTYAANLRSLDALAGEAFYAFEQVDKRRSMNLDGSPARRSKRVSRKRCGGISKVGRGGKHRA